MLWPTSLPAGLQSLLIGPGLRHEKNLVLPREVEVDATPRRIACLSQWDGPRTRHFCPQPSSHCSICPHFLWIPFLPGVSLSMSPESVWAGVLPLSSFLMSSVPPNFLISSFFQFGTFICVALPCLHKSDESTGFPCREGDGEDWELSKVFTESLGRVLLSCVFFLSCSSLTGCLIASLMLVLREATLLVVV